MIDNKGMIKEMELEEYSNDEGKFSLEFNQTPFGDLAEIKKHRMTPNGFKGAMGYKSKYFEDSRGNVELLDTNIDKAKEWFYDVLGIS